MRFAFSIIPICLALVMIAGCNTASQTKPSKPAPPADHPANLKSIDNSKQPGPDGPKKLTVAENKARRAATKKATVNEERRNTEITDHYNTNGLKWMTIDEAATKRNGKPFLIDVYTEWCGWCKVMDKKTFSDPEVQEYLRENYNIVKFDAEQKAPIEWKGKTFEFQPGGRKGVNTLARHLLGSRMGYPTIVYLDKDLNKVKSSPGFKDPEKLLTEIRQL